MKVLTLEIKNWDSFNPRSDVKSASWFRMSNRFFVDPDFYGQPLVVRSAWLYILCEASSKMSAVVKINTKQIADGLSTDDLKFTPNAINEAIAVLLTIKNSKNEPILAEVDKDNNINTIESDRKHQSNCPLQTDITNITDITNKQTLCTEAEQVGSMPEKKSQKKIFGALQAFSDNAHAKALLKNVPQDTQELWLETYVDVQWINSEFTKIVNWLQVNPQKAPKSRPDRFISNWLTRGWESHRKSILGTNARLEHRTQGFGVAITESNPTGNPFLLKKEGLR